MEQESPLDDIKRIRSLMERSSISHALSGLSGIAAGIIGIAGYFVVCAFINPMLEKYPEWKFTTEGESYLIRFFIGAGVVCLGLVFACLLYFNFLKSKRTQIPLFDEST